MLGSHFVVFYCADWVKIKAKQNNSDRNNERRIRWKSGKKNKRMNGGYSSISRYMLSGELRVKRKYRTTLILENISEKKNCFPVSLQLLLHSIFAATKVHDHRMCMPRSCDNKLTLKRARIHSSGGAIVRNNYNGLFFPFSRNWVKLRT